MIPNPWVSVAVKFVEPPALVFSFTTIDLPKVETPLVIGSGVISVPGLLIVYNTCCNF